MGPKRFPYISDVLLSREYSFASRVIQVLQNNLDLPHEREKISCECTTYFCVVSSASLRSQDHTRKQDKTPATSPQTGQFSRRKLLYSALNSGLLISLKSSQSLSLNCLFSSGGMW